ncbi:SpoIIAA-like protein [Anseongella ginsenosidimutans]|uniref:SpoIIAA-like protein n=2 Tax=Anseongella ginsenosidimutans TaxID=496056 RepID=A0A4R3KRQ4_9SPHI|nr:SpoIIAA-like protein [Anseongella ginsenosidimutans]
MLRLLSEYPDDVVAYEATGRVNHAEYERIVMRRVDQVAARYGKINFIVVLKTKMERYSAAALLDYLLISFRHFSKWNRMAIVSDEDWVRNVYSWLSPLFLGAIRSYCLSGLDEARQWIIDGGNVNYLLSAEKPLLASVKATSLMTSFSYLLSYLLRENFKEPRLLGSMIHRLSPLNSKNAAITGWLSHYSMGAAWTHLYHVLLKRGFVRPSLLTGLGIGVASGVVGILIWKTILRLHPDPPAVKSAFYRHLLPAHILFALAAIHSLKDNQASPVTRARKHMPSFISHKTSPAPQTGLLPLPS